MSPRGILKNAPHEEETPVETPDAGTPDVQEFDRQKVIENTLLNSKLFRDSSSKGDIIRSQIQEQKRRQSHSGSLEHLQWDEKNILINEQEKSATMKIDEPKTPYEGGFDPNNDYYRTDNEDEDHLDDFDLGEGAGDDAPLKNDDRIEVVAQEQENQPEEKEQEEQEELTPEQKHKLFEERRKQHYHLKANPLKKPIQVREEEE
ncbi:hypothetical protein OGAPHI_005350 [Ogataea philodendri]|uniref:Protein GLC8 n=1 Tax=Ogataea philodendri TaxID=1378263 RepID=A0A9P8P136_9ASCO|nr:uncharacterized protein OGAPHI_005350 [Ogataea philodendri]KAH3663360.1 hypothetical protein OGAPHI_005350 [Ogataea philodendri]